LTSAIPSGFHMSNNDSELLQKWLLDLSNPVRISHVKQQF
jgi:hypothetical protein